MTTSFRPKTFSELATRNFGKAKKPYVCLVTGELVGPFKNGGLGTSMTGLIELLAAHGAPSTVLYTGEVIGDVNEWVAKYRSAGIELLILEKVADHPIAGPLAKFGWTNAWNVFQFLKTRHFDIVHFNDTMGEGSYCFVAKRLGLAFDQTLLTLAIHSPTQWILESNGQPSNWAGFSYFTAGERISIANTDLLWGPSLYLLNWIRDRGYVLPDNVFNQQYVIPTDDLFAPGLQKIEKARTATAKEPVRHPDEIVFFGRLEERKGIRLFINAIRRLAPELAKRKISIKFMGKSSSVNGIEATDFIAARAGDWKFDWDITQDFGQQEALSYLRDRNCLAVMASPIDNSPCTIYEALQFGLPFIAARTGGIPELIHKADHKKHLFDHNIDDLCARMLDVLDNGISNARPAITVAENQDRWIGLHESWKDYLRPVEIAEGSESEKIGFIIDHFSTGEALAQTIASIDENFGNSVNKLIVHRHEVAEIPSALTGRIVVYDELSDCDVAQIIEDAVSGDHNMPLVMLRSGIGVTESCRDIVTSVAASACDAGIPMTDIGSRKANYVHLAGNATMAFLEPGYDAGGLITTVGAIRKTLGDDLALLDRNRVHMGVLDELYVHDGLIWPVPDFSFAAASGKDIVVPEMHPRKSIGAFAQSTSPLLQEMLTVSRTYYSYQNPATISDESGMIRNVASKTAKAVVTTNNPRLKNLVYRCISAIFGRRTPMIVASAKRWIRGT